MATGVDVLLEAARRERNRYQAQDPLRQWIPTPKQYGFIDAVLGTQCYENWFIAANRAGKSEAGAYCGATLARQGITPTHPAVGTSTVVWDRATTGWIVGPDYGTLTQVLLPKYLDHAQIDVPPGAPHQPFIPGREIDYWDSNAQEGKLKNGSLLRAKSHEQKTVKFAAAGVDWIHFDEEPPESHYNECTLRIEAGRRLRIFGTCTLLPPEGIVGGVSWVYERIIRPWEGGVTDIGIYGASIYDNPHLDRNEITRLESRYPVGSAERLIRLEGHYLPEITGHRAYGNYESRLHLRPQGLPSPHTPLCWFWDFNVAPLCCGVGQRDRRGCFHVYKEFVEANVTIPQMVDRFRDAYPTHGHEIWLYGDATGQDARTAQSATSDYRIILEHMRHYPTPVRVKLPTQNPRVRERLGAVNMALRTPQGERLIEIDPSCRELDADLRGVILDPNGGIKKTSNPKDPYHLRTHISDALGYWVVYEAPVRREIPRVSGSGLPLSIDAPTYHWAGAPG